MSWGRKRPIVLKDVGDFCPHCEAMGWQFGSSDSSSWTAFLELSLWENIEELVFSMESVLHPRWDELRLEAVEKGFKLSLWLCGHEQHLDILPEEIRAHAGDCDSFYPIVSDFNELYSLRRRWKLGSAPLVLCFHEKKMAQTLKLFQQELRQDLFPVWGVFPERNEFRKTGIAAEALHNLFYVSRGKKMGQGLSPFPGLEMMDLRRENAEDLIPADISLHIAEPKPKFSIVIPAYGSAEELAQVLDRILKLKTSSFEVVLVDEGNPQDLKPLFDSYLAQGLQGCFIKLPWSENRGAKSFRAGRARNIGAMYSRGEVLCFLDSDILLHEAYLLEVEAGLRKFDLVQALRYDLKTDRLPPAEASGEFVALTPYWEKFRQSASVNWNVIKHPWKYICTHSLSLRKSLFMEVGGFSSLFNSYGYEDTDLGYRCFQKGKTYGLLETPVFHMNRCEAFKTYKLTHAQRYNGLKRSGSLFLRNHWDQEVFAHCHYLFHKQRAKWAKIQALGRDFLKKVQNQRNLPS